MLGGVNVLLSGIVGSIAYGLATPASDVDRLGVFAAPTESLLGLRPPKESIVTTAPDRTMHEAAKYVRLALAVNPTVTELLWLPDDLYETRTGHGEDLVAIRSAFLSAGRVRDAYLGYAAGQFRRLAAGRQQGRGPAACQDGSFSADTRRRTSKHARHLARLLHQGRELYATGRLTIRLEDPEHVRDLGERVAAGDVAAAKALLATAEADFDRAATPLPARPDEEAAEKWLLAVRRAYYRAASGFSGASDQPSTREPQ